ncbi:septal ring lytic transglycosylase RlpA family protein [Duganella aceris]|uniref:Endolytic peptidoglycan transglycosylase RlpA n=1 Tax=Duganella aceris TaxID=2703883 RepID=A0ABX0FGW2_9BURK|nr:septal ring lytic transglycosylase RlpA family protein [Duganella aceris]NGZ83807.1 septal ring lytic transglycosylase RlpA family protein [Duganella aceris]
MNKPLALWSISLLGLVLCCGRVDAAAPDPPSGGEKAAKGHKIDRSGKTRKGKASYYSRHFNGKEMANGEKLDPASNQAASKVLPIGTTAKVTNLDTGDSAVVVVKDRGPYVDGRIIDVTPRTAEKLDMKKEGVADVAVTPLQLPPKPDDDKKSEK